MSQTFDLHIHLQEGNPLEFSQIPQNEAPGLQQYMAKQGVSLSQDADVSAAVPDAKAQPAAGEASESDSEEVRIVGPTLHTCCRIELHASRILLLA